MTKGIKRFYPDGHLIKIITFKLYIGGVYHSRPPFIRLCQTYYHRKSGTRLCTSVNRQETLGKEN